MNLLCVTNTQAQCRQRWNKTDKDGNAINVPPCGFIQHFLCDIHAQMTQYASILINHKVTSPKDLGRLSSQRLKTWGVSKKAHRRAILAQVCRARDRMRVNVIPWACTCSKNARVSFRVIIWVKTDDLSPVFVLSYSRPSGSRKSQPRVLARSRSSSGVGGCCPGRRPAVANARPAAH